MNQHSGSPAELAPFETMNRQSLRVDEVCRVLRPCGYKPIDGHFDEVVPCGGPCKGANDFHRAIVNRNNDLRRIGVRRLAERTGKRLVFIGKIGIVIRMRMIKRFELAGLFDFACRITASSSKGSMA